MLTLSLEYVRVRIIPPLSPAHHHYHHHDRHQPVPTTTTTVPQHAARNPFNRIKWQVHMCPLSYSSAHAHAVHHRSPHSSRWDVCMGPAAAASRLLAQGRAGQGGDRQTHRPASASESVTTRVYGPHSDLQGTTRARVETVESSAVTPPGPILINCAACVGACISYVSRRPGRGTRAGTGTGTGMGAVDMYVP